jgi:pyruvate carboxylase
MYAAANDILGRVPKVTPSSKVVGDLALHLAAVKADPADFERTREVRHPRLGRRFHGGELGDLPGGWPEPFRTKVLQGVRCASASRHLDRGCRRSSPIRRRAADAQPPAVPAPTKAFREVRDTYGDLSPRHRRLSLRARAGDRARRRDRAGVQLYVGLEAIGEADDKGMRTVMTTLNGQLRPVFVRDRSITVEVRQAEKADTTKPGQVAAPFSGVVTLKTAVGDRVRPVSPWHPSRR